MNKICVIHFIRDTGGVAKMMTELANEQVQNGIKVVVFHTSLSEKNVRMFHPEVYVKKIKRTNNLPPMLFGISIKKKYKQIQKRYPDYRCVVHAHNIATIGVLSNVRNVPIVCTLHGISWFGNITLRKRISRFLTAKRLRFLQRKLGTHIVAVSNTTAKYYNKLCKMDLVCSVYNGINKDVEREPNQSFTIGFIGDISDSKGWNITLNSISLLDNTIRNSISFVAAGRPLGYSNNEIEKQIYDLQMEGRAEYLGLVTNAYHSVMPKIDILLLPSISEGLPMSIIEAQSLGIPVIATAVGGIPEIIKDGENGIIVERDPKSISFAIERLCNDVEGYKNMVESSKKAYYERFTSRYMHKQYLGIYKSFCKRKVRIHD